MTTTLILGSGPAATDARDWPRGAFDRITAINNAHRVRPDWDELIHPWDFPADRMPPQVAPGQRIVTEADFVPAQNAHGGFVYGGGTMAFTAGYWVLSSQAAGTIAFFGCDMVYPATGPTHFYGTGEADPLRADITLQSLEAKSARLMVLAAEAGCAVVNLSAAPSRLVFPRAAPDRLGAVQPRHYDPVSVGRARDAEAALGYDVPSGRYWEEAQRFDPAELARIDRLWLEAAATG